MNVFVLGYPSKLGGADTELWHVVRLWRMFGVHVTLIPTWGPRPAQQAPLDAIGASTIPLARLSDLSTVSQLRDSVVVSFCNSEFIRAAPVLRQLNCRLVWVNCMTYVTDAEAQMHTALRPFDAYVFQSSYQQTKLALAYLKLGADPNTFYRIRGAFFPDEFPYRIRPRTRSESFVVGRIARPDPAKWSSDLWRIYGSITHPYRLARVMAWSDKLNSKCGAPPVWAETLPANAESAYQFLNSLHCFVAINGGAEENWPRAGLEAMASGIPIVTEDAWGWQEMIDHGKTGFLSTPSHLASYANILAEDDCLRLRMARDARERLESEIANPNEIWDGWRSVFVSLGISC